MSTKRSLVAVVIAASAAASASRIASGAPIFVDPGPLHSTVTTLYADLEGRPLVLSELGPDGFEITEMMSFDFMFIDMKSLTLPAQIGAFEPVDLIVTADDGPIGLTQGPSSFYFSDALARRAIQVC